MPYIDMQRISPPHTVSPRDPVLSQPVPVAYIRLMNSQPLQLMGSINLRTLSALSPTLVYLNLSHNAFEGELPIAALSPHWADDAVSRGSNSRSTPGEQEVQRRRRKEREATMGMVSSPLSYLNLSHNKFTGRISPQVGELVSLETLDVSCGKLEGELPPDIGNCIALRVLSVSRCGLSGRVDGESGEALGRLRSLETLRLDANTFEGSVPAEIGNLTRLEVLNLQVYSSLT